MKAVVALRPRAFTLVELLVGIGIVGMLMALLLSAVQRVREAASRIMCAQKMRQLGLAAANYAVTQGRLPDACTMPYAVAGATPSIADASGIPPIEVINDSGARIDSDPNRPFGPNWAVYLLPYLEQTNLYQAARVEDYLSGYYANDPARRDYWRTVVQKVKVKAYVCPSDTTDAPFDGYQNAPGPWMRGNYAANAGPGWWQTSYEGGSYTEAYGSTGPVMGINFGSCLSRIPDGTSNTVLFNEVRAGVSNIDPRGVWAMGYPGSSVTAANAIGDCTTPNDANELSDDLEGCPNFFYTGIGTRDHMGCSTGYFNLGWPSWQAQARSRHTGGVNVCFADGSVRFVSNFVDQATWFAMLSTSDGVPYALD
jgi:prepilin-type processing-associated H-X9-DG protein/prepilin-type N-terminal cleavage/methylation domain-containing protein